MNFAFINTDGQVMAVQSSPNPPAPTKWETVHGYTRILVPAGMSVSRDYKLTHSNGVATGVSASVNPVQPDFGYEELREVGYGSFGDQLDMIYHDSVNGTTVWQDHIAAVKAKYPKP